MRSRRGRNPRVLLLLHEMTRTGAPLLALRIFRELRGRHDLRIVAETGGNLEEDFKSLAHLTVLTKRPPVTLLPGVFRDSPMVAKAYGRLRMPIEGWRARRWRPDVVYANSVVALPLVERMGLESFPVLVHVHELSLMQANFEASYPGLLRRVPRRYVAVSEAVASALRDEQGVRSESIAVIPPFVEVPTNPNARNRGQPFVVGGVGNPSWTKGVDLWLLAARDVIDRLGADKVRFRWVGLRDNEEGRHFRAMVKKLAVGASVDLVPETENPSSELAGFDVLAVSSWEESASLAALEAMALSVPVVCFLGSGGPPELIGDAGVVVDTFSPSQFADAIAALLMDDARRGALGVAGRARVVSYFRSEQSILQLADEIRSTMTRYTPHP